MTIVLIAGITVKEIGVIEKKLRENTAEKKYLTVLFTVEKKTTSYIYYSYCRSCFIFGLVSFTPVKRYDDLNR